MGAEVLIFWFSNSDRSKLNRLMSIAQQRPVMEKMPLRKHPSRRHGRWAGYLHLLSARMLELKREPQVVVWVLVMGL
jgi:hypothetical protein